MAQDKAKLRTSVEAEVITDGGQQNVLALDALLERLEGKIAARKVEMDELSAQQQQVIETGEAIGDGGVSGGGGDGSSGGGIIDRSIGEKDSLRRSAGSHLAKVGAVKHLTNLGAVGAAGAVALAAVAIAAPKLEEAAYSVGNSMSRFTKQDGVQKFNPYYIGKASAEWAGEKAEGLAKDAHGAVFGWVSRLSTLGPLGDAQGYDTLEDKQQRAESIARMTTDFIFGRDPEMIRMWDDKVAETIIKQRARLDRANSAVVGELAGLGLSGDLTEALAKSLSEENQRRRWADANELEKRLKLKNEAAYESGEVIEAD